MKERSFFDTNILIYTDDSAFPEKQKIALQLFDQGWNNGNIVLSTQVLQEYFVASTRKLGVLAEVVQQKIELLSNLDIMTIEHIDVIQAIDIHRLHSFSFWDSLIIRMAQKACCPVLFSENMQHERQIGGVKIINPFLELTD